MAAPAIVRVCRAHGYEVALEATDNALEIARMEADKHAAEARAAVRQIAKDKPDFIKIWVDDREGRKTTLSPALYRVIAEEAHRRGVPVGVHNVKLADAKELMRAGVEGWLHVPVRGGDAVDEVADADDGADAVIGQPLQMIDQVLACEGLLRHRAGRDVLVAEMAMEVGHCRHHGLAGEVDASSA